MISTLYINTERTKEAVAAGYILATDVADYLVKKGIPFRQAHTIVAELVRYAIKEGKDFHQLSLEEYKRFSPIFDRGVYSITLESSLAARNLPGGTAPQQVEQALKRARRLIDEG
jgi:argininosuccinate lyase